MTRRFSDIKRAAQLQRALTGYTAYLNDTDREPNVGSRGRRNLTQTRYVTPFNQDLAAGQVVAVKANPEQAEILATFAVAANGADSATSIGTNTAVAIPGFSPARLVVFRNQTYQVNSAARSAITNTPYLKYAGDRLSIPFGRATATDDMFDVFAAMKADVVAAMQANFEILRVSLQRENIRQR